MVRYNRSVIPKLQSVLELPEGLVKTDCWAAPPHLGWSLVICMSDRFSGAAADLLSTFKEPLV